MAVGNLPDVQLGKPSQYKANGTSSGSPSPRKTPYKSTPRSNHSTDGDGHLPNGNIPGKMNNGRQPSNNVPTMSSSPHSSDHVFVGLDFEDSHTPQQKISGRKPSNNEMESLPAMPSSSSDMNDDLIDNNSNGTTQKPASIDSDCSHNSLMIDQLKEENRHLMERYWNFPNNVSLLTTKLLSSSSLIQNKRRRRKAIIRIARRTGV